MKIFDISENITIFANCARVPLRVRYFISRKIEYNSCQ